MRKKLALKNIFFGYLGTILTALLGFVLKQVFIRNLGDTVNGVNGLYTGILSMLNIAELGIGTAMNYALYGPVARGETEKIKSFMAVYKKAYRCIAAVIAVAGLVLIPFLPVLARNANGIAPRDLTLYYLIFLFNTVSSYFVSYKYSLVNAEQRGYIQTNIYSATKIATSLLQLLVLVFTKSFYAYLLTDAAVQLTQKVVVSLYLDHRYPYLRDKKVEPLLPEESAMIRQKTSALIWLKIGDVARLQTDALIISSLIEVRVSGLVDNYNMVINSVGNFAHIIFNSLISGFGNLIATEDKSRQEQLFMVYRFAAAWIYGYTAVAFYCLLTPFVEKLWLGVDRILPSAAVTLILMDYYFRGERIVLSNFKTAAGVFEPDKFLPAIQGLVNLILSIGLVLVMGLPGIYVGTVISGLIANVIKPRVIFRTCFGHGAGRYYRWTVIYAAVTFALALGLELMTQRIFARFSLWRFLLAGVLITLIYNGIFALLFRGTPEFGYLMDTLKERINRKGKDAA